MAKGFTTAFERDTQGRMSIVSHLSCLPLRTSHKCMLMHCCRCSSLAAQASNILVGRDGSVRLSDLGVAAKLERHFSCAVPEGYAKLERRNTFVGSPAYIAPELLTGLEQGCAP